MRAKSLACSAGATVAARPRCMRLPAPRARRVLTNLGRRCSGRLPKRASRPQNNPERGSAMHHTQAVARAQPACIACTYMPCPASVYAGAAQLHQDEQAPSYVCTGSIARLCQLASACLHRKSRIAGCNLLYSFRHAPGSPADPGESPVRPRARSMREQLVLRFVFACKGQWRGPLC